MKVLRAALILAAVCTALAAENRAIPLFNGKDFSGWRYYYWSRSPWKEITGLPVSAAWSIKDSVIYCEGKPTGFIQTLREYENYKLSVEWRWPVGTTQGNSGVLVHSVAPDDPGPWPKSVEVQLAFGNAGDLWVIGTSIDVPDAEKRRQGRRHVNLTDNSEKPAGEWNRIEILCRNDEVTVRVNGDLVNHATRSSVRRGAITLQSEGAPIHFRNIYLTPLE